MNTDGYPHTNREFRRVLIRVKYQLLDVGESRRMIERVLRGMVRHENLKRLRHPHAARDRTRRTPVPRLVDFVLAHDDYKRIRSAKTTAA